MSSLQTVWLYIKKKAHTFFVAQTAAGLWVRLLCVVIVLNIFGITLSLIFFSRIQNMNQSIIVPVEVEQADDVDRASVQKTLEAFSRRVVEFEYRKTNGVSIPEPK
ncbi:MAG: hypothetical protein NUW02_01300 [Candidatus Campbellbacteria bacterium]|nr:hypothetical protein [Candidatus Campbellbacteria bacterium]